MLRKYTVCPGKNGVLLKQFTMKKIILGIAIVVVVAIAGIFIFSGSSGSDASEVFVSDGKAIKGYDPVAFFEVSEPVMGKEQFSYDWNGATWLFSSKENMNRFKENPEAYAPQYGGYCAYGTSQGHKAPVEIDTWSVIDGKLYFNYNGKVKETWDENRAEFILEADKNWPKVKGEE